MRLSWPIYLRPSTGWPSLRAVCPRQCCPLYRRQTHWNCLPLKHCYYGELLFIYRVFKYRPSCLPELCMIGVAGRDPLELSVIEALLLKA